MRVSIVTISFNQVEYLEQAIRSVLDQDYPDIEYIVVDPGSADGSRDIIERYRDRIQHIIYEPDNGPADGLNRGFSKATGDIYAYLNSDDLLCKGAVSHFVTLFDQWKNVDVISSHGYKVDENGCVLGKIFSHQFDPVAYVYGACVLVQQSTFFRAKRFHEVGGFNAQNRVSWDGELWFDMAVSRAHFLRVPGYWSYFRLHPDSITVSGRVRHEEEGIKRRLAARLGIEGDRLDSSTLRKFHWLKVRAFDPDTTFKRILNI
jgi:glycosyltransferase involved in cell wall biosynthesis